MFRGILILMVATLAFGQPGRRCTIVHTNGIGVCKKLADCRHVLSDIRAKRPYTRCGFEGRREVVCCPPVVVARFLNESKSVLKCREYAKAVYTHMTINGVRTEINECGHLAQPTIVDGELAGVKEFPHMALLGHANGSNISWFCGGSLISEDFVLTAAHCTIPKANRRVSIIRLGELDYSKTTDTAHTQDFNVAVILNHPLYSTSSVYNDIALIRLDRSVTFSPFIRPACLPTEFQSPGSRAIASGWGTIKYRGPSSSALLKVTLDLFTTDECRGTYSSSRELRNGILEAQQLCAGSKTDRKDTCQGDSGGPLQVFRQSDYCTYTIIGVTSFGAGCGTAGVPGVYARVFNYLQWIESTVWP